MAAPEDEENSVKLTKYKKMSSTSELDKYDDNTNEGEDNEGDTEDEGEDSNNNTSHDTVEDTVDGGSDSIVKDLGNDCSSDTVQTGVLPPPAVSVAAEQPVEEASSGGVHHTTGEDWQTVSVMESVTEVEEDAGAVGTPLHRHTVDDTVQPHTLQETHQPNVLKCPISGGSSDCRTEVTAVCKDQCNTVCGGADSESQSAKTQQESACPTVSENTEATPSTTTCHNSSEGGGGGCDKDTGDVPTPQHDTAGAQAETLLECHSSDDQDSLHLSDVEDSQCNFSSSASPLDLSDLLRISEDVLSNTPAKTLCILQVRTSQECGATYHTFPTCPHVRLG